MRWAALRKLSKLSTFLVFSGASYAFLGAMSMTKPALALAPVFIPIAPENFFPIPSGVSSNLGNVAPPNSPLDDATGSLGFDNAFGTDRFVSLGAFPNQNIAQSLPSGTSEVRTTPAFGQTTLASLGTDPLRPFVSLVFDYVFDGVNTGNVDNWQVFFLSYNTNGTIQSAIPMTVAQNILSPTKTTFETGQVFVSTAGIYGFQVLLNEALNPPSVSNTAFGFNNVTVKVAVPYELETGLGLGAVGLFMAYRRLKKRAAFKGNLQSIDQIDQGVVSENLDGSGVEA